jgi:hypothetical protein
MVILGYFVVTRYFWTLKTRILKYLVQLLPEPVVRLLTPASPPTVAATATDEA